MADRGSHRVHCFTVNKRITPTCTLVPILLIIWMLDHYHMASELEARMEARVSRGKPYLDLIDRRSNLVPGGSRSYTNQTSSISASRLAAEHLDAGGTDESREEGISLQFGGTALPRNITKIYEGAVGGGGRQKALETTHASVLFENKEVPDDIYPPGGDPEFPAFLVKHGDGAGSLPRQKGERPAWPAAGWNGYDGPGLDDPNFTKVKFYLYDEGPTNMRAAEECMRRHFRLPKRNSSDPFGKLDQRLKVNAREYLLELFLLPALRKHPMRTMVKAEATLFVIGYAHNLAKLAAVSGGCRAYNVSSPRDLYLWENRVADVLSRDENFKRNAGKDHIFIQAIFKPGVSKRYLSLLQDGPIIATCDRYFVGMNHFLPKKRHNDQVIVVPYVPSTFLDLRYEKPPRNKTIKFFFRGNMHRQGSGREVLRMLNASLPGADFDSIDFRRETAHNFSKKLHATAKAMRSSDVCLAPEGDDPTSLRLFESLLSGCVPVVSGTPLKIARDLPFPSLINWDEIAFFVHHLGRIATRPADTKKLISFFELQAGRMQTPETKRRLQDMRTKGMKVYDDYFSYFRNPHGVATALLYEAWVLVQKQGIIPYTIGQLPS